MKLTTSKSLWVSPFFTERFGSKDIKPAKTVPSFKKLERDMSDSEILKEFGVEECTLEDVAAFIKNPPKGCDDANANIFYISGCVVRVHWSGGERRWSVRAWYRGDDYWRAGRRAFSRNWASDTKTSDTGANSDALALISEIEERLAKLKTLV